MLTRILISHKLILSKLNQCRLNRAEEIRIRILFVVSVKVWSRTMQSYDTFRPYIQLITVTRAFKLYFAEIYQTAGRHTSFNICSIESTYLS